MKNIKLSVITLTLLGLLLSFPASAITLSLIPANATAAPGEIVVLDLVIDGLGFAQAPSVGDFEVDLGFDSAVLEFVSYSFGDMLGDTGLFEAIDVSFGIVAPGLVNLAEVSLLAPAVLDATQSDTFVLATLQFMVSNLAASGVTVIDIVNVAALADATATPLTVDTLSGSELSIAAVPAPAGLWLLGSAVFMLFLRRNRD